MAAEGAIEPPSASDIDGLSTVRDVVVWFTIAMRQNSHTQAQRHG